MAAKAIGIADDAGQGNWGSAILGGIGVAGSIKRGVGVAEDVLGTQAVQSRGWKVGEPVTNLTGEGNIPAWTTVRRRYWKNKALNNSTEYNSETLDRMRQGLAPQRKNFLSGKNESIELHHEPPQRQGGLFSSEEIWPEDHTRVDPYRHIGK